MPSPSIALACLTRRCVVALWLLGLLAAGAYVRIHGVGVYYYSLDELAHIQMAQGSTASEVARFSRFELHPLLPNLLRHFVLLAGDSPFFMRGVSVFFGLLCIPAYFVLGTQAGGTLAGCVAAWLAAFSYGLVLQSQIVRDYTLFAFAMTLPLYYGQRYLRTGSLQSLGLYTATGLVCMAIQFDAVFAFFVMYAVAAAGMPKDWRRLLLWSAANALFALYFGYQYFSALQHNPYALEMAAQDTRMWQWDARVLRWLLYFPATVSYYLYCTAQNAYSRCSLVVWVFTLLFLSRERKHRVLVLESLFALALGASLTAAKLYPYGANLGGRHAIWLLPYLILPVSLSLSNLLRASPLPADTSTARAAAVLAMPLLLASGIALDASSDVFADPREYLITVDAMQQMKAFEATLTPSDMILTGKADVMYVMPQGDNIYRRLAAIPSSQPYGMVEAGNARAMYMTHYSRFVSFPTAADFITRMEAAGLLAQAQTLWFFNTRWSSPVVEALLECGGLPRQVHAFAGRKADVVFVGVARRALLRDVIAPGGRFHACWRG